MAGEQMFGMDVEGGKELAEAFKKYGSKILSSQEMQDGVVISGIEIGNEAKKYLNTKIYNSKSKISWRRTGLLKARTKGDEKARIEHGMIVTSTRSRTKYAKYIEFGTGIFAKGGKGRKTPWVYKTNTGKFLTTSGAKARPFLAVAMRIKRKATISNINKGLFKFLENNASKV